ncbi:hypothetical protein CLAIMM_06895 isoform 3 [Cladophialophora immunda]|nr:hypothetical protein CLAIMM_06895 isoform 1 [Cladophialophora immunda]OQV01565.1 hypothetical protein CLAIMM_06895 isoform 3 [Cladophialophora immunda]
MPFPIRHPPLPIFWAMPFDLHASQYALHFLYLLEGRILPSSALDLHTHTHTSFPPPQKTAFMNHYEPVLNLDRFSASCTPSYIHRYISRQPRLRMRYKSACVTIH